MPSYPPGTLRGKLFGRGARLSQTHPVHHYRDIEVVKQSAAQPPAAE